MKKKKINSNNLLLLITIVLFFVMYAAGCIVYADKGFTRFQTFLNILINNAGLICITAGMTCVMLTGGIDISVGSLVAMDCMILAVGIEQWGWSSPVLMLLILAIGIIFGIVQGFCISYMLSLFRPVHPPSELFHFFYKLFFADTIFQCL